MMSQQPMTLRQTLNTLGHRIDPSDARLLMMSVLGMDFTQLSLSMDQPMAEDMQASMNQLVKKLEQGHPIQYVLGHWPFIDIELKVDLRALIPRPETEILAKQAVNLLEGLKNPSVIDVGCGSGCIGLYIKNNRPDASVTLCDLSADALDLTSENAASLGLDVTLLQADMRILPDDKPYDLIVSNPPYIKSDDITALDISVKAYEPHLALDGGSDGLVYYRALSCLAIDRLSPEGVLAVEVGINQADDVRQIFMSGFDDITIIKDLSGIDRVVTTRRRKQHV